MNIKGIIFDLDGTLIDSMEVWSRTDMAFLKECGVKDPPPDVSDEVKKMTVDDSAMYFINRFGLKLSKEYVIDRIEELVRIQYEEKIPLKPYVPRLLDRLDEKGIPYGVATATYKRLAEAVLKRCGIYERFRFVLTDEEYPLGKTCPDIFLGATARLGTEISETLVVEDSLHCCETAKKAGFIVCGVYDSVSACDRAQIEKIADHYFESLAELCALL